MRRNTLCHEHGYSLIEVLAVLGVVAILAAAVVPVTSTSLSGYRFQGDGQAVSHMVGLAKMRAAARSTRARLYVDIPNGTFTLQTWNRVDNEWENDSSGTQYLSRGSSFDNGDLASPPPNQDTVNFSDPCKDDLGTTVADTACVLFNSRGLPIDSAGALESEHAIYLTNGVGVYAVTVMPTGQVRFYWSPAKGAHWTEQQ